MPALPGTRPSIYSFPTRLNHISTLTTGDNIDWMMIAALGRQRVTQQLVSTVYQHSARKIRIVGSVCNLSTGPSNSWDALEAKVSKYAVVDHGKAYEEAMNGRHGAQLALAQIDGVGKDDMPFDPFEGLGEDLVDEYLNKIDPADLDDDREEYAEAEILNETTNPEKETAEDEELNDKEEEEALDYIDDLSDELSMYKNDGSPRYSKSQLATFRAGYPAGGLFAVINIIGSQNKVTVDDVFIVHRLKPQKMWPIGSIHTIKDVLLVGSSHKTLVGMPNVAGAEVDVMVEEITRDAKVIVYKSRRRKNSQTRNGFRRDVTMLRVLDIRFPKDEHDHIHTERVKVKPYMKRLS